MSVKDRIFEQLGESFARALYSAAKRSLPMSEEEWKKMLRRNSQRDADYRRRFTRKKAA